jgi:putative autotransporter adhesin-like protein
MPASRRLVLVVLLFTAATVSVVVLAGTGALDDSYGTNGSGIAASQTRLVSPFQRVDLAGSNNVSIRVGGKQSVVVHGDAELLGRVTTHVRQGTLVIGNTHGSFSSTVPMLVEVTVPALSAVKLDGSGVIVANGVRAESLTAILSGSGILRASGRATQLDVRLPGSGEAQLGSLAARDALAVLGGSGRIDLSASHRLDAEVSGSGTITYHGHPLVLTTSITGSGSIVPVSPAST